MANLDHARLVLENIDALAPRLSRRFAKREKPESIRSDNGTEFVARMLLEWMLARDITPAHIDPALA